MIVRGVRSISTVSQTSRTRPGALWMPAPRASRLPVWLRCSPFIVLHLALLAVLFTPAPLAAIGLGAFTYFIRMFGITGAYHRYFAHRSYKTSRVFQFL